MKLQYVLIFFAVALFSTITYLLVFKSTEGRTKYPGWTETTTSAWFEDNAAQTAGLTQAQKDALPAANIWAAGKSNSDKKYEWTTDADSKTDTQRVLTERWIERTVDQAISSTSITSQSATKGVKSILVRKLDGTTAELPIMDFFKKLHEDMVLGWQRAKDYADKISDDILIRHPEIVTTGKPIRLGLQEATQYKLTHNGRGTAALQDAPGNAGQMWTVFIA
jgi:hypothetical protein